MAAIDDENGFTLLAYFALHVVVAALPSQAPEIIDQAGDPKQVAYLKVRSPRRQLYERDRLALVGPFAPNGQKPALVIVEVQQVVATKPSDIDHLDHATAPRVEWMGDANLLLRLGQKRCSGRMCLSAARRAPSVRPAAAGAWPSGRFAGPTG